jgi:putative ABC transport system permease protein
MGLLSAIDTTVLLGLCFSGIALGLVVSLRFLNFPDLTIEGSVPLGGSVGGVVLVHTGSFSLAILAAVASGALAGCFTATLHVFFGVGKLLSGILMLAALYSISLRVLGGSNLSLLRTNGAWTRFDLFDRQLSDSFGVSIDPWKIGFLSLLICSLAMAIIWFFNARPGIAVRAVGDNERVLPMMGRDARHFKYVGLALANCLGALAGCLVAFNQGFADVGMGQGGLVLGLAGLILGEQTLGRIMGSRRLVVALVFGAVFGSILYQCALSLSFQIGVRASDVKLLTAGIVLMAIVFTGGDSVFYKGRTF